VHTRSADISRQGSGVVTTGVFAQAAFAHRQSDFGYRLLQLNAEAPRQERMPGAFTEMIPPGGSDFVQLWSAGPFLAAVVEGMAGVRPNAFSDEVEISPQLPTGIEWVRLEHVRVGRHELRIDVRRLDKRVVTKVERIGGAGALGVVYIPARQEGELRVQGKSVAPVPRRIDRLDRDVKATNYSVPSGKSVTFSE
jgi:hypothetical protein